MKQLAVNITDSPFSGIRMSYVLDTKDESSYFEFYHQDLLAQQYHEKSYS